MARDDEMTFVIHGLSMDNGVVRARVFVQKLGILVSALQVADKLANGRSTFDYLLPKLHTSAATAIVRERPRKKEIGHSSISFFERTAVAVYNGDRSAEKLPPKLVGSIEKLSTGVEKNFSHGELAFSDENVIRIDEYLLRQAEVAYDVSTDPQHLESNKGYRGIAFGTFDGILQEVDARGTMLRGKLVLNPGVEIDCVMNKDRVPDARENFDKRVVIKGAAHYDGTNPLPTRLDVHSIRGAADRPDLLRWKGAFRFPEHDNAEDDW